MNFTANLSISLLCATLLLGCGEGSNPVSQPTRPEKPLADAVPVVKPAAKTDPRHDLLVGLWELHSVQGKEEKIITNVTVEFTQAGEMISRENANIVTKGKFVVDGDTLNVITPGAEPGNETREAAQIVRLTRSELVITNVADKVKISFRRNGAAQ